MYRGLLFVFATLMAVGSPLRAQEGGAPEGGAPVPTATPDPKVPIKMTLASPFALVEKPLKVQARWSCWMPIQITLSNTGEPVSGRLTLRMVNSSDSSMRASEVYTEVDLPTTSRKQVWLYARMEREGLDEGEITFTGRGFRLVRAPFGVEQKTPSAPMQPLGHLNGVRLVLSVSATGERANGFLGVKKPLELGLIKEIRTEQSGGGSWQSTDLVRPLGTVHKNLPTRWIGLQTADAVILHDFPFAELSSAQLEALRGYVAGGGALIVPGGANWDRLAKSPLADLWPVTPASAVPATPEQRNAFFRRYISRNFAKTALGDNLAGAPLMLTQASLRPGATALWGSSSPMMAVRHYGAGQVVFLAFDPNAPPFLGWRGIPWLWKEIFARTTPPTAIDEVRFTTLSSYGYSQNYGYNVANEGGGGATWDLLQALKSVRQLKTPPVSTIAWFLALYVFFLVPVNYCVLRLFDKRELAWVTVPVIVVAFSVMSYAAALRIKGSTLLARQANIVQGTGTLNAAPSSTPPGEMWARSDTMLWLFSPRKTAYTITGEDPRQVAADYIHSGDDLNGRVTIAQPGDDKPIRVEDAAVNMWAWRAFVGHSTVNVKGGVQVQTAGGKPVVKNATPFEMRGVVVKWDGRLWTCGDIKPGASATGLVSQRSDATGANLASQIRTASALDRIFPETGPSMQQVASSALPLALNSLGSTADALVTGWSKQPASGLTIEDSNPAFENATLFLFKLD